MVQQGASSTEYFLGDALGSVRQWVDGDGVVLRKAPGHRFVENSTGLIF